MRYMFDANGTARSFRMRQTGSLPALLLSVLLLLAARGTPYGSAPEPATQPSQAAAAPAARGKIKLAFMAPITGEAAAVGTAQLNFVRLAVEHFNTQHGTDIELVEGDTELDPAKTATLTQRLIEDQAIHAIVGPPASQEVAAAAPVAETAAIAMVSPSATRSDLTEQGHRHLFRVAARDDVQGPTDAAFIAEVLGAKKVWIIDDQGAYSTGLADETEKGLQVKDVALTRESISQQDTDFSALVTRIKADAPDVVFTPWQLASQAVLLAKQMAEQGVEAKIVGGDGLLTEDLLKDAGGSTEGVYASFFAPDVTTIEASRAVIDEYRSRHGDVDAFGPPAYAATMVALGAFRRAQEQGNLTRETVLAEVAKTNQPTSILGIPIQFDAKGDIRDATFFLYEVKGGKFVQIN